ncbi:hypothetical protein, partial [Lactiplantibacillus plantarum]|uniref:hypothetical protein n=1 Tax=Lactiplantibacillus plantarum TaxID=1590 RepID=UPI001C9DA984
DVYKETGAVPLNSEAASLNPLEIDTSWCKLVLLVRPKPTSRHFCQLLERGGHRFKPQPTS